MEAKIRGSNRFGSDAGYKKGCNNLCYNLFLWTSLGLNQGPPDYESVALTN